MDRRLELLCNKYKTLVQQGVNMKALKDIIKERESVYAEIGKTITPEDVLSERLDFWNVANQFLYNPRLTDSIYKAVVEAITLEDCARDVLDPENLDKLYKRDLSMLTLALNAMRQNPLKARMKISDIRKARKFYDKLRQEEPVSE